MNVREFSSLDELEGSLTDYMNLLASIGSNAPYVGMLGTVLGIMSTFHEMGLNSSANAKGVMEALSQALFATALGLVVAIPTIFIYNLLLRKVKKKVIAWKVLNG